MLEEERTEETQEEEVEETEETTEEEPLFVARNQKDLDKKFGAEKRAAAEARDKALMEKYGVDSLEDLDQIVNEYKTIQQATETEVERLQREQAEKDEAIATANRERDEALKLADSRLVDSELKGALTSNGVDAARVRKILGDPDLEKPSAEDGEVTKASLDAYVKAAKKEWPELFGSKKPSGIDPTGRGEGSISQAQREAAAQAERERTLSTF